MENKRKASGANGLEPGPETPDRAAKRRKLQEEFGDLSKGETAESTTAFGLSILESIRSTTDKSGRTIAPFFENLPNRDKNPKYYKQIKLPLSLQLIEQKLNDGEYDKLSTLEGDLKRLVLNAKETNPRNTEPFSDAERVRKAVSNLMVKYNPAYKSGSYQAIATPIPDSEEEDDDEEGEEEEEDEDEEEKPKPPVSKPTPKIKLGRVQRTPKEDENEGNDEEEEEEAEEEDGEGDEGEEDEEEEEEEAEVEEDQEVRPTARRARRRAASGRASRRSGTQTKRQGTRGLTGKADHRYEDMTYKDCSFQQAQEKIVEDLIRRKDEEGGEFPYFEVFLHLPPKTLKDYYDVIAEPLSLRSFQKQVRGQHGRAGATYISDFKSWTAFTDQASLMWKNAYHYNEDGSPIFEMGQELEKAFHELLKEAKQHVQEPPQPPPKIKLKVTQNAESSAPQPKKITIHVGGKGSAAASPSPATTQQAETETPRTGTPLAKTPLGGPSGAAPLAVEKTRSQSGSASSPAPGAAAKSEDGKRPWPPQSNGTTVQQFAPPRTPDAASNGVATPPPPPPAPKLTPADILERQRYRSKPIKESEALLQKLVITSHPGLQLEKRYTIAIPASTTEYQQETIVSAPSNHFRLQLKPEVSSSLEGQQREWKLNVLHDAMRVYPSSVPFDRRGEPTFDASLRFGMNRLEVSLVAALPKGETNPDTGLTVEMERMVVHFNLLRTS